MEQQIVNNPNSDAVADFYDEFAKKQVRTGLNLRHYLLFDQIKKSGLKRNHDILEIGCGIGTFTKLLLGFVRKGGSVLGVDISKTNISIATKELGSTNANFMVSDMTDFKVDKQFDYIVMLDVLEHIPMEQHNELFKIFRVHLKENGTIFINIPHHDYLDYVRKNEPEKLQIIDQSLSTDLILNSIYNNDLQIVNLNSHSIFNEECDYQRIVIQRKKNIARVHRISKGRIILRKSILRVAAFLGNL
ncbi:class I SAM-dependent methyltransferase [Bacteroidota bacterium]